MDFAVEPMAQAGADRMEVGYEGRRNIQLQDIIIQAGPGGGDCVTLQGTAGDVNEGHHKAILTEKITTQDTIFDFTSLKHESLSNQFKINPENATQLICNDTVYQVTSETVSDSELGNYITAVAEQITFDSDTKKPLSKDELNSIDWFGKDSKKRDFWVYSDIYEISGIAVTEAVAVKINNQYYKAEVK